MWLNIGLSWKITKIRTPVQVSHPKQVFPKTGVLFLQWISKMLVQYNSMFRIKRLKIERFPVDLNWYQCWDIEHAYQIQARGGGEFRLDCCGLPSHKIRNWARIVSSAPWYLRAGSFCDGWQLSRAFGPRSSFHYSINTALTWTKTSDFGGAIKEMQRQMNYGSTSQDNSYFTSI